MYVIALCQGAITYIDDHAASLGYESEKDFDEEWYPSYMHAI